MARTDTARAEAIMHLVLALHESHSEDASADDSSGPSRRFTPDDLNHSRYLRSPTVSRSTPFSREAKSRLRQWIGRMLIGRCQQA